jgi:hypothetical protein
LERRDLVADGDLFEPGSCQPRLQKLPEGFVVHVIMVQIISTYFSNVYYHQTTTLTCPPACPWSVMTLYWFKAATPAPHHLADGSG